MTRPIWQRIRSEELLDIPVLAPPDVIGRRLRSVRKARGLTQQGLAALVGVKQPALSYWETGVAQPSLEHQTILCDVLASDWDGLFGPELEKT